MSDLVRRKMGNRRMATLFVGNEQVDSPEQSTGLEIESHEARLVVTGGKQTGHEYLLHGNKVTIGRGEDTDVMIDESSASRRHAQIEERGGKYFLRDLGSTNGTYFDGLLHGSEKCLSDGDRFQIGKTCFVFRAPPTSL